MTRLFACATAKNAPLYRAIMRVFMESRERFVIRLSQRDVVKALRASDIPAEETQIESALVQLCEWGNLGTRPDTTDAGVVEDFYKQRHTFEVTTLGLAAERAFALFEAASTHEDNLQYTGLADIRHVLQELKQLSRQTQPDAGTVHRSFVMLLARFEEVSTSAQAFIARLEQQVEFEPLEARRLIDYGERFVAELVLAGDRITEMVHEIEADGFERLLGAVAGRVAETGLEESEQRVAAVSSEWRSHWERFRKWFVSQPGRPSDAERFRERARTRMPALLSLVMNINDRRMHRIHRSNDFQVLARWFAQAGSDGEAHALWRAVFGLCPARHLLINDETLDDYEAQEVTATASWLDAPPLRVSTARRTYGRNVQTGLSRIIDRSREKEKLAVATHDQALAILNAQTRFVTGRRMRLSDLESLEIGEFDLFLDLIGEAVSARVFPTEPVEIVSGDGCLRLRLEPALDGAEASIATAEGLFSGPDHWITIEPVSTAPEYD